MNPLQNLFLALGIDMIYYYFSYVTKKPKEMGQLSFADIELGGSRKKSRISVKLDKIVD